MDLRLREGSSLRSFSYYAREINAEIIEKEERETVRDPKPQGSR